MGNKFQKQIIKKDTATLKDMLNNMEAKANKPATSHKMVRTIERRACLIINELSCR
jgi:hypothetical protein